jgi:molybdopterin converting factor small subunit
MPGVRLLGPAVRRALGAKKLDLPGADVAQVLEAAARSGGPAMAEALFASPDQPDGARGELNRDLRVLVNGRNILWLDGVETKLGADDSVTLHHSGARGWPGG